MAMDMISSKFDYSIAYHLEIAMRVLFYFFLSDQNQFTKLSVNFF